MTREHSLSSDGRRDPRRAKHGLKSTRQQVVLSVAAEHGRPISTTEIARLIGQTLGATAHHVRRLVAGGYLAWAGERRARGAVQTFYMPSEAGLEALRRPRVEALFLLVGAVAVDPSCQLSPVAKLDERGMEHVLGVLASVRPRLEEAVRESQARNS